METMKNSNGIFQQLVYGNNETAMGVFNNLFMETKARGHVNMTGKETMKQQLDFSIIVKHIPSKYSFFFAAILRIHYKIHCEEKHTNAISATLHLFIHVA